MTDKHSSISTLSYVKFLLRNQILCHVPQRSNVGLGLHERNEFFCSPEKIMISNSAKRRTLLSNEMQEIKGTSDWLQEQLRHLQSSLNFIRVIKSRKMRWEHYVVWLGKFNISLLVCLASESGLSHKCITNFTKYTLSWQANSSSTSQVPHLRNVWFHYRHWSISWARWIQSTLSRPNCLSTMLIISITGYQFRNCVHIYS
jgi:hypothetical protein